MAKKTKSIHHDQFIHLEKTPKGYRVTQYEVNGQKERTAICCKELNGREDKPDKAQKPFDGMHDDTLFMYLDYYSEMACNYPRKCQYLGILQACIDERLKREKAMFPDLI